MAAPANFHGYEFEAELNLLSDLEERKDVPAVYVIYTTKKCLDIGETDQLKTTLETHEHTRAWFKQADGEEVYFAFYLDPLESSRKEIVKFLTAEMKPVVLPNS